MSNWEIEELNGWTPSDKKKPQLQKAVLVWVPWRVDEVEVKHLRRVEGVRAGDGKKIISYRWYPGGSGVEGSCWRDKPRTPTLKA